MFWSRPAPTYPSSSGDSPVPVRQMAMAEHGFVTLHHRDPNGPGLKYLIQSPGRACKLPWSSGKRGVESLRPARAEGDGIRG